MSFGQTSYICTTPQSDIWLETFPMDVYIMTSDTQLANHIQYTAPGKNMYGTFTLQKIFWASFISKGNNSSQVCVN